MSLALLKNIGTLVRISAICTAVVAQAAEPPPAKTAGPAPTDLQRSLDDAVLARRIEEYSGSKKGEERAAEDNRARVITERFVAAFVTADARKMLAESSAPWVDRAELIRDEAAFKRRIAEYRVPGVAAKGKERITLLMSLAELEQALGKKIPDADRKTWADHLADGSRIVVVQRGPMLLGFSLRRLKFDYRVSGLLFDYFPKPDDALLRAVTKSPLDAR